jgi:hypothetical protein
MPSALTFRVPWPTNALQQMAIAAVRAHAAMGIRLHQAACGISASSLHHSCPKRPGPPWTSAGRQREPGPRTTTRSTIEQWRIVLLNLLCIAGQRQQNRLIQTLIRTLYRYQSRNKCSDILTDRYDVMLCCFRILWICWPSEHAIDSAGTFNPARLAALPAAPAVAALLRA